MILLTSCDSEESYIPNVFVNIHVDLSLPEYSSLDILGNSMFIEGGNAGIIIYHFAINEYKAYDRNCSYEPSSTCAKIDSISSGIAICGCCSSAFLINALRIDLPV